MAIITTYVATVSWVDGVKRPCSTSVYVNETDAKAWFAAADASARALTNVGVLMAAINQLSDATLTGMQVTCRDEQDTAVLPAETVLRGNKLFVSYAAAGRFFHITIPARDPDDYTQGTDSLVVSLSAPAAMLAFVSAFNATARNIDGQVVAIDQIKVVD